MKNKRIILTTAFIALAVFGTTACVSNGVLDSEKKVEPSYLEKEMSYEDDFFSSSVKYPEFMGDECQLLNEKVAGFILGEVQRFKESLPEEVGNEIPYDLRMPWVYDFEYEVFYGPETVSVFLLNWQYTGGAHGNAEIYTFCYNLKTQSIMNIEEATGMDINTIAEKTRQYFIEEGYAENDRWFLDGTEPEPENYSKFVLNGNTVEVYYPPYYINCYAAGIQTARFLY